MKLRTSILTVAAALVIGGGVFASQAIADPTPQPLPTLTATATATATGRADRVSGQARVGWFYSALTDVQRQCLADAAVQRPEGKLTTEQRKQLRAKIDASIASCGVKLPDRLGDRERLGFGWAAMTAEQQQCLAGTDLTRPVGRLTAEERAAVRKSMVDAAAACGVSR